MVVRGAPAIGCAAAYGVALEAQRLRTARRLSSCAAIELGIERLAHSRPTAVNLAWALARMRTALDALRPATAGRARRRAARRRRMRSTPKMWR